MKSRKILLSFATIFLSMTVSSCEQAEHDISEYILEMPYKDDFRVLQLTDIHVANKDDRQRQYDFLKGTIELANADLIVITGDTFTFGDKTVAKEVFSFFDSCNIPWTITFGNHDEQCYFSIDWLTGYLNDLNNRSESNCIFKDIQDDNVTGNANFAINLTKNGKVVEQLIIMDSNRYQYGSYIGYDYIKQDQIDWYSDLVDYSASKNNNQVVSSLLFFHIPLPEWDEALEAINNGSPDAYWVDEGIKGEKSCPPLYNSGFFDKILEKGSTKGIFVGHDHVNAYTISYKGVWLSYGVNSTDRIYFDKQMIGGSVITIHSDSSLSIQRICRNYDEYE